MAEQKLDDSSKYKTWRGKLEANQIKINSVDDIYLHRAKDGDVLYALLKLDADTPEGNKLNPICFLKGDAVSMLVVLIDDQTGDKSVLLVRQRRICDGSETYEHPAGMIDEGEKPIEVAARELKEEAKLNVGTADLVELSPKPLYSATATSDEALFFYYCELRLPGDQIRAMHGRQTGEESENEHTSLFVASFPEAHRLVSNLHGIMGHLLYLNAVRDYETMQQL